MSASRLPCVVSDCGAIGDIYLNHKIAPTAEQGPSMAVKAGTDLNCGVEYQHLLPAVPSTTSSSPRNASGFLGS